jgi:serine/threonine protein kinase
MNFFRTLPRIESKRHDVKKLRIWRSGEIIANRWFVHRAIPPSNMGIVYFCYDMSLGIPMVIKAIPPQFLSDEYSKKRFVTECETWIRLGQHPNIVKAYFVETVNTYPHVFVEWVNGKDIYHAGLDSWLGTPALTLERSINIVAQVCDGMQYVIQVLANNAQIFIHRDIKPSNILITND